jgi:hypothetical protein
LRCDSEAFVDGLKRPLDFVRPKTSANPTGGKVEK